MNKSILVLGEALMDCIAQPDGTLKPLIGGSPYNLARAAALRGADVSFVNPLSTDNFGDQMRAQLAADGVKPLLPAVYPHPWQSFKSKTASLVTVFTAKALPTVITPLIKF
jgi:hypothetical protein